MNSRACACRDASSRTGTLTDARNELTDEEGAIIAPLLPNKVRSVPRVDDRRVIDGML